MNQIVQFVGPNGAVQLFGVKLVGITGENAKKLLFSVVLVLGLWGLSLALSVIVQRLMPSEKSVRVTFWSNQAIHLATAILMLVGLVSIWFNNPASLTTAAGMVTAGIACALQRVITAFAGYFVILRGKTFNIGDRIVMGGVRGDVIALGFIQTTVMEMGQPASVQDAPPAIWVHGRQYTGRIVTITNDKIFDEPVYNYSRDFPYLWEEMSLPIPYNADRGRAEEILLQVAREQTVKLNELGEDALKELERRYFVRRADLGPAVFYRLTDNWIEMSIRFITRDSGIREIKNNMSRAILSQLEEAGIGIASGTYEIVGVPPVHVVMNAGQRAPQLQPQEENGRR